MCPLGSGKQPELGRSGISVGLIEGKGRRMWETLKKEVL
jgi:hypothetical protein